MRERYGKRRDGDDNRNRRKPVEQVEWVPRTELGRKVKSGEVKDIDEILNKSIRIKEAPIVDHLIPNIETDFIQIGQSKGKFGGGKRKLSWVTQKKTAEGSAIKFSSMAVIGNKAGIIGIGIGKSGESVPAKTKAEKVARLNLMKIRTGCGSWECACNGDHSIPFAVEGREGSVWVKIMPAPKGTGLAINETGKQILSLAGIKDVWSVTMGQTPTRHNLAKAIFKALRQLRTVKQ